MRRSLILLPLLVALSASAANLRIPTIAPAEGDPDRAVVWHYTIENVSGREHGLRHARITSSVAVSIPGEPAESVTESIPLSRVYLVTSTADSGPGSLRQALLDMNAHCAWNGGWPTPCLARFAISEPLPAPGWHTIRPLTPLPDFTAYDAGIDATTQGRNATGGPVVALDGSALESGHGLTLRPTLGSRFEITGLSIGGFPWNGIYGAQNAYITVRDCYIGVDPSGQRATPNRSRGIASAQMSGLIENNVLSGNAGSGIFFMGQHGTGPTIRNNRIGVAAHDDTPIGNGASGIFIADFFGYYANPTIEGNVIANNVHFGIALTANAPMIIRANTIRDHGQGGIDIGLDGPTESAPGVPGVNRGIVPPPVILSATYANGVTTIRGRATAGNNRRQVFLYANRTLEPGGFAEGEQYLGATDVLYRENTDFTFVYPGDLRGVYVNGAATAVTFWSLDEYSYTSSEFGRAVPVGSE